MPVACVGKSSEVGLFALLTAPLRPRSAKASPAYFLCLSSWSNSLSEFEPN